MTVVSVVSRCGYGAESLVGSVSVAMAAGLFFFCRKRIIRRGASARARGGEVVCVIWFVHGHGIFEASYRRGDTED
jgi:hypothetical protein